MFLCSLNEPSSTKIPLVSHHEHQQILARTFGEKQRTDYEGVSLYVMQIQSFKEECTIPSFTMLKLV